MLEANDVAVLLRSDRLEHIADASKAIFDELGVFAVTSIRRGFAGGGFDGGGPAEADGGRRAASRAPT